MIRVFATGMRLQLLTAAALGFDLIAMLIWPIILASIAYYLLDAKESPHESCSRPSLGTAVMIMWAQVVDRRRRHARQPMRLVRHARTARRGPGASRRHARARS